MKSSYSIEIERPQQVVFDFLDDPANIEVLVPNLAEHGMTKETPEKVGSTFWHVYEEKGRRMKMTGVVTEHDAPRRSGVALDGPVFSLQVIYELEALDDNRTRLTQHSAGRFKHVFKLMGLLFGKKMKRDGEKVQAENFARLKHILETGETQATTSAEEA